MQKLLLAVFPSNLSPPAEGHANSHHFFFVAIFNLPFILMEWSLGCLITLISAIKDLNIILNISTLFFKSICKSDNLSFLWLNYIIPLHVFFSLTGPVELKDQDNV